MTRAPIEEYKRTIADPSHKYEPTNYLYLKKNQPNREVDWSEQDRLEIGRWTQKSFGFYGRHRLIRTEDSEVLVICTGQNPSIEYTFQPKDKPEAQIVPLQNTPSALNKAREIIDSIPQA